MRGGEGRRATKVRSLSRLVKHALCLTLDDGYISKGKKGKSRPPRRARLDEPELHSDKPPRTLRVMALNVASLHAGRRSDALPLALQKLFQARLLRPGISMLLDHPEWWQDVRLIAAVIAELEDNGARPLAQRVRRTLEMGVAIGPGGRVRLWSDPKPKPASKVIKVDSASLHVEVQAAPLPPALKQLFHARLFRAAVFTLLDNPGWWEDEALMATVITKLEDNGAPSLAYRVRRTLERGVVVGAGGRVRLWSDPKRKAASEGEAKVEAESESKAEPTAEFETASQSRPKSRGASNRVPLVPRIAYPETTEQARRTHHWNLLLTQWLTVQHPIPYASPFERARPNGHTAAPARLRRLRDVLHTIDKLRRTRDFVPDRVTANIVLKAYLSDLARNTHGMGRDARPIPNRAGVRAEDVLEMFKVIAVSMEDDVDRGLVFPGSETGEIRRSEQKRREKGSGPVSPLDFDGLERFDPHVSYEKHVLPFTRMIGRALARVGSHRGRVIVEKWGKDMRARILKLQSEAESGKGTVEDKSK